ncbi:MAG: glycosyltransferase family 39 protein [Elusimicrobia bacterium]|nr:glycosyltransferase family 39 protein [Elusimicrobiota bacterium]
MRESSTRRRELAVTAGFLALVFLPYIGKAYHNDEPFFLAAARQVLIDPLHPLAFDFTWYGRVMPAAQINTTPPLLFYLLALALKLTGGAEWAMRLSLFPLDLAAAAALYLLAARFLAKPLLPTLIVIATPAYLINMNHLMPEKLAGALGFWGLYAAVRWADGEKKWFAAAAGLLAAAILSKYNAALFVGPAAVYAWRRGLPARRVALLCLLAAAPAAALVVFYYFFEPDLIARFSSVAAGAQTSWWSSGSHRLRSFLAFIGGCGVVTAAWPFLASRSRTILAAALASLVLFLPALDLPVAVRLVDRLAGMIFACGALLALGGAFSAQSRRARGWPLWASWLAAAGLFQFFYWSIMARMTLFMLPPLIFLMAERFEASWGPKRLESLYLASLAAALALSLPLAFVDARYAAAQREFSRQVASDYLAKGRRVWYSGYMGLSYYLGGAGAQGLDAARGGWDLARPGDAVVVLGMNSAHLRPSRRLLVNTATSTLSCPVPLRLMSGWTGEGGFYSNLSGFLPYSLSTEPLEEFTVVELK